MADPQSFPNEPISPEQQILDQGFELARLKRAQDIQDLKLALLQEICQISTGTFEIDHLLDSYREMITKVLNVPTGSLLLTDQNTGKFSFRVAKGERADAIRSGALLTLQEIASQVVQSGQPYFASKSDLHPHGAQGGTSSTKSILEKQELMFEVALGERGEEAGEIRWSLPEDAVGGGGSGRDP